MATKYYEYVVHNSTNLRFFDSNREAYEFVRLAGQLGEKTYVCRRSDKACFYCRVINGKVVAEQLHHSAFMLKDDAQYVRPEPLTW